VIIALSIGEGADSRQLGAACVLFTIAALTDFFDGYLARRWNLTSTLGAFLDTTADKLLVTGSLLALVSIERVSVWAALVIVMREFVVMALRGLVALGGGMVRPSQWGKIKATSQFVAIGFAFIRLGEPIGGLFVDQWLMLIAVVLTIVSAWQYLAGFWDTVRSAGRGATV
jgi:CDP-diacylglycerol--glycerol-3-phosphate 3-phosphatidyltransferase